MKKLIIWGILSNIVFFLALTFIDVQKNPKAYTSSDLYYVESIDSDGYYHARNKNGTVVFLPENVQGNMAYVGSTVVITLDVNGEQPQVKLY